MHRLSIRAFAALVALATAASAGATLLAALPTPPAGNWSHATINVTIKRAPHTLTYDRGRVESVTANSLTLVELGSPVTIPISPSAQITISGQPASLSQIQRLEIATTLRIDGGAAIRVSVRVPPALAAALARQARRQARQQEQQQQQTQGSASS